MKYATESQFLAFLEHDMKLPEAAIALAQKQSSCYRGKLPVTLWHLGLVTLDQVSDMFDWLENSIPPDSIVI